MNPHGTGSPGDPVKETFIQRIIGFCAVNRYLTPNVVCIRTTAVSRPAAPPGGRTA